MGDDERQDRKRARRHQNAEAQRRYRGRQKGKSHELEESVQQLRNNVVLLESQRMHTLAQHMELAAVPVTAAQPHHEAIPGPPGAAVVLSPQHLPMQFTPQLQLQHLQLHAHAQAQAQAQAHAQAHAQAQAQAAHGQAQAAQARLQMQSQAGQPAHTQSQTSLNSVSAADQEAEREIKLNESICAVESEIAQLKQQLQVAKSMHTVGENEATATGADSADSGTQSSPTAAAAAAKERKEVIQRAIAVLKDAIEHVRPGKPCERDTTAAIWKAVTMLRESSRRNVKHRVEMLAPQRSEDINDWFARNDAQQCAQISVHAILQEYIDEQLPRHSSTAERESIEQTSAIQSSGYLEALQDIYGKRQKIQDALGRLVDLTNLAEKLTALSPAVPATLPRENGSICPSSTLPDDGQDDCNGTCGDWKKWSPPLPASVEQWTCRLQHRAAVMSLVAGLRESFREEHELGSSFKFWILDTLPPVVSARFLLKIFEADMPLELTLHLLDALALQFATDSKAAAEAKDSERKATATVPVEAGNGFDHTTPSERASRVAAASGVTGTISYLGMM